MKIALVYHGVLRWPQGIHTQLEQLKEHDVDTFFCLQKDSKSADTLKYFNYKKLICMTNLHLIFLSLNWICLF